MTQQPKALQLADELEMWTQGEPAAAELRLQHAEIERLRNDIAFYRNMVASVIVTAPAAADDLIATYEKGFKDGAARRQWVGLTDEERDSLIPDPDGSAEANVRSVEILPGAWGKEYEEVDAWSEPLVLQMLRDHEAKLRQKNT